jgi:hypothetical protein
MAYAESTGTFRLLRGIAEAAFADLAVAEAL